ncbi:MAG TPA: phosphopantetheine-binding protein [Anaerolineae bacterium]|nr:phosphopantetheine-binding protein [Anaerolineae bacterium]
MTRLEPLTFEAFRTILADMLDVDEAGVMPQTFFVPDLGVDSLRLVGAMLRLQKMGLQLSLESIGRLETVGDAYEYYQQQAAGNIEE